MSLPIVISPGDPGHIGHHEEIHELLGRLDGQTDFLSTGVFQALLAGLPAAGPTNLGLLEYATDVDRLAYSDGSAWQGIALTTQRDDFDDDVFFGSGRPWVDVEHDSFAGGADPTAAASSTAAFAAAGLAAFPTSGVNGVAILHIGPGIFDVDARLTIGKTGARYNKVRVVGAGRLLTTVRWTGVTTDGPFKFLNCHEASLEDLTINDDTGTKPLFAAWFAVENSQSAFNPRTERLHCHKATYGLVLGGGTDAQLLDTGGVAGASTGQYNDGLHTSLYASACDESVRLLGANGECQTFIAPNFFVTAAGAKAIHSYNCRGIYIMGGETDFAGGGDTTIIFAEGANLNGGGFSILNHRVEDAWCAVACAVTTAWANTGSGSAVEIVLSNVMNQLGGAAVFTDPCDMVRVAFQATIVMHNVTWPVPNSRVRWTGLNSDRWGSQVMLACNINHSIADTVPGSLTGLDASAAPNGDWRGVRLFTRGCRKIGTTGTNAPSAAIKDVDLIKTQGGSANGNIVWEVYGPQTTGEHYGVKLNGMSISSGAGAPAIAGVLGDYYFRTGTPSSANQRIYTCTVAGAAGAATWVGIV